MPTQGSDVHELDWNWWSYRLERSKREIAIAAGQLIGLQQQWVHRRVQRLEFIDTEQVRWSVLVDFALPVLPDFPKDLPVLVPLALPEKARLIDLVVTDEESRPVPVLTRSENAMIATEILKLQAERVLETRSLPPKLVGKLAEIAGEGRGPSNPDAAARRAEVEKSIEYFVGLETTHPSKGVDGAMWTLWQDEAMRGILWEFATRFILLAQLDRGEHKVPRRRIIKVSYDRRFRVRKPLRRRQTPRRWSQDLALSPYTFAIGLRSFRAAQSYHLQIIPPDELFIVEAAIERYARVETTEGRRWLGKGQASRDRRTRKAHLHVVSSDMPQLDLDHGELADQMVLTYTLFPRFGVLLPALASVLLMTLTLVAGLVLHCRGIHSGTEAAALIVAVPALFTPWLVPGDHPLVRRMFRPLRSCLLLATAAGFGAAGALAIDLSSRATIAAWAVATFVSGACTLILAISAWRSWEINSRRTGESSRTPRPEPAPEKTRPPLLTVRPSHFVPRDSNNEQQTPEKALDEIARQHNFYFHIVADSGEGLSIPFDGSTIAERSRRSRLFRR